MINKYVDAFKCSQYEKVCGHICKINNNSVGIGGVLDKMEDIYFTNEMKNTEVKKTKHVDTDVIFNTNTKNIGIICKKCGAKETKYKMIASRSADEGMQTFCVCGKCNHKWKLYV